MKRSNGLILASTLMLFLPSCAFAQYDADDRQCIYPSSRMNYPNASVVSLGSPAGEAPMVPQAVAPVTVAEPAGVVVEAEKIESKSRKHQHVARRANDPIKLDGSISKTRKASKHPEALSLKFTEDKLSRTLLPGSTFTIALDNELNSKDAAVGDKVSAHLIQDLRAGDQLLAPSGAKIEGTVSHVYKACKGTKSNKMNGHLRNANGGIQMEFNKLVCNDGIAYDISAAPASGSDIQKQSSAEQKMSVNKRGEVGVPYRAKTYESISFAITTGSIAAGPFGFAAAPALCAFIGTVSPSYGLGRPSKPGEKHRRLKGALMGALRGSPGGFITSGFFVHGLDAKVSTGDQVILQLSQPLTVPSELKVSSAN
jgi:hypothetical protein